MTRPLIAYETAPRDGFALVTAPHDRDWMDTTPDRAAYRCLPMLMANQSGWWVLCPATVRVKWDGGATLGAIEMQRWQPADQADDPGPEHRWPTSHFGSGIITWTLPFLFRTPPGYNILVRGPANCPKDGIFPLEGLVETDWAVATFTMNLKITRPDHWITFEQGEPIAMIVPQRRGELEEFAPQIVPISDDPALETAHAHWGESRDRFNEARKVPESEAAKEAWQKHYFQGNTPDGGVAPEHQTRLRLQEFTQ